MALEKLDTIQDKENLNIVYRTANPGPGGACHEYAVVKADTREILEVIQFQKGPRKDPTAQHGVLDCDLLEMVRDRLKSFQEGEYSCYHNAMALEHVELALFHMFHRVMDRKARNVLGTMEK